jgi:hypothetical protein
LTEEDLETAMIRGNQILRERYAPATIDAMRRIHRRYLSFCEAAQVLGYEGLNEMDYVLSFIAHLQSEGLPGQTLEPYLCLLQDELGLQGIRLDPVVIKQARASLRKTRIPACRANPLLLGQVKELILTSPEVTTEERAFLVVYWLAGQRPGDLLFTSFAYDINTRLKR